MSGFVPISVVVFVCEYLSMFRCLCVLVCLFYGPLCPHGCETARVCLRIYVYVCVCVCVCVMRVCGFCSQV